MLRLHTLPPSLRELLEEFRPCFTAPSFTVFALLLCGLVARPAGRTVTGMLAGAGLGGRWHHGRAHRFLAAARWSADEVGLVVLRLAAGWLVPAGAPLVIAVDDTMFRRSGRRVDAAHWGYDGSLRAAPGNRKLSRGNTWVIAALVVTLPFLSRPVALPVAARLWRKGGPARTALARQLIELVAASPARGRRPVHAVADAFYACSELRALPPGVTLTARLPSVAVLHEIHPEAGHPELRAGRPGRPRTRGERIGTAARLAAATAGREVSLTRYGRTATATVRERRCLWPGAFRSRPVRVLVITDPGRPALNLVTTDLTAPAAALAARYASRWSIEAAFRDAKTITGAGEARTRVPRSVERAVPLALYAQSLVIIWYHLHGHRPAVARARRAAAPWYPAKACPSYLDMITQLRRALIAARFTPDQPRDLDPAEITAIRLAWAEAAA